MRNVEIYEKTKEVVKKQHRLNKNAINKKIAVLLMATTMMPLTGCYDDCEEPYEMSKSTTDTIEDPTAEVLNDETETVNIEEPTEIYPTDEYVNIETDLIYDITEDPTIFETDINYNEETTNETTNNNSSETTTSTTTERTEAFGSTTSTTTGETTSNTTDYTTITTDYTTITTDTLEGTTSTTTGETTSNTTDYTTMTTETTTSTTTVATETEPQITEPIPTEYTLDMIAYDINAFNYFAEEFAYDMCYNSMAYYDGITYESTMSDGVKEAKVALAALNKQYIQNDVLHDAFEGYNESDWINGRIFITNFYSYKKSNEKIDLNKYIIDKDLANLLNTIYYSAQNGNTDTYIKEINTIFNSLDENYAYGEYGVAATALAYSIEKELKIGHYSTELINLKIIKCFIENDVTELATRANNYSVGNYHYSYKLN